LPEIETQAVKVHPHLEPNRFTSGFAFESRSFGIIAHVLSERNMKTKTRHRKTSSWKKKANSSPIAKGRRAKRKGRNPGKMKHIGGRGL